LFFPENNDPCVPFAGGSKSRRPFVGILIEIQGRKYYAPLSSPKSKHLRMKNQIDFLKIDRGSLGVINFNNMIPIHTNSLMKIQLQILLSDTQAEKNYKNLLTNQLSWCNSNRLTIFKRAKKLYIHIMQGNASPELLKRCCNFTKNEEQYNIYCKTHGFGVE
jgi:protein AbiQ